MEYNRCPICNEYAMLNSHTCPAKYYFKHPDWGEEFQEIRAYSFEGAAEKFAEKYFEDLEIDGYGEEVSVVISNGKEEKKILIRATLTVDYEVEEVEED